MFSQVGGWKTLLSLTLIFIAGVVSGAVGSGIYVRRVMHEMLNAGPREIEQATLKRVSSALNLSPQQEKQMQPIVRQAHERLMGLRAAHQGEIDGILGEARHQAEEFLNSDQQVKLERVLLALHERWQRLSPQGMVGNFGGDIDRRVGPPGSAGARPPGPPPGPARREPNEQFDLGPHSPAQFDSRKQLPHPQNQAPNQESGELGVDSAAPGR